MNKPDKDYLKSLIEATRQKFDEFEYPALDLSSAAVSYIPTKKRNYMGLRLGIDGLAEMNKYKVKESPTIRSNCMYYHKLFKVDNKVAKIDSFVNGHDRLSDSRVACYEDGYRYLFPYHGQIKATWSYICVTHFENGNVAEEYMVCGNQIVYEKYAYFDGNKIGYYCINYVSSGKYPVLSESEGFYFSDTMEYIEESQYVWDEEDQT